MDGAMSAAVSSLKAQSSALGTISNNLANSSTTGYKAVNTQFLNLLTTQGSQNYYPSGGVRAISRQDLASQGNVTSTNITTDLAIDGNGLFVVQNGAATSAANPYSQIFYTRNGSFTPDNQGNLQLSGTNYYLMGWATNPNGTLAASSATNSSDTASLQVVNIQKYNQTAGASSYYQLKANLPAEATVGATFTTSMQVYDTLGVAQIYPVTFTRQAVTGGGLASVKSEWTMTVGNPTDSSGVTSGTITAANATYHLGFDSNGALVACATADPPTTLTAPTITGTYNDGSTAANFKINFGTNETTNVGSITQYDTGQTTPAISIKSKATDGIQYGDLTGVSIDSSGYVVAAYSNGTTTKIYQIPIATFTNEDGLSARTDGVYAETSTSGKYILNFAGANGTGSINGQALEASNVDTSTEFSNMITCQQAYSASSQVIGTDKQMFQSLLQQMQ